MEVKKRHKLTRKEITKAVTLYANKNNYFVRTVRVNTALKHAALKAYRAKYPQIFIQD